MKTSTSLKVVRIPYDASAIHLTDIALTSVDPNAIKKDEIEEELGHFPDIQYVRLDERADLPQNKHLRVLHYLDDVTAYRDAFVFKMKPGSDGLDQSGHTEYLDMGDIFVLSAQNWGFAMAILWELLMCPRKGVQKR